MKAFLCKGTGDFDKTMNEESVAKPELREHDLLVKLDAIGINPVDVKNRDGMGFTNDRILGYDGAGVVEAVGSKVSGDEFKVGDKVYFAGDVTRNGTYAEYIAVDARISAKQPSKLSATQAAAVPLVGLTAWEMFFDCLNLRAPNSKKKVLIVNGAGGVGSMAIQLARVVLQAEVVVATASRPETEQWCRELGATHVINHRNNLKEELTKQGIDGVDVTLCCVDLELHYDAIVECSRSCAGIAAITLGDASKVDVSKLFFPKRLTLAFELMFARPMTDNEPERQGEALRRIAELYDQGKLKPIDNKQFDALSLATLKEAHALQNSGKAIGKIVLDAKF